MSVSLPRQVVEAVASPYPGSFDGSTVRFQLALFSLMTISVVGGMLSAWMASEIWQGRREAYPYEPLFAMRLVFLLASIAAVMSAAPEVAVMITWREDPATAANIMVMKRWIDSARVIPALGWIGLVFVFYPAICMGMVRIASLDGIPIIAPKKLRARMTKLVRVTITIFAITMLIALGKRW